MAEVHIDRLTNLSAIEQRGGDFDLGVLMELRREALVSGLNLDPDTGGTADFRILQEALNSLPGGLAFGDSPIGHPDLVLIERVPRLIPGEQTKVVVELVYKRFGSAIETMGFINEGNFRARGGGTLRQITTGKNQFGVDIVVCYTYPAKCSPTPCAEAPGYPHQAPCLAGTTKCQGGEVQVDLPSDVLEFEGRWRGASPGAMARTWRGFTNNAGWNGGDAGEWRCSEVTFTPWDIAGGSPGNFIWLVNFYFQFDPTGWNPDAIFRDPITGKPPPDLVQGDGVITVDWYPERNFSEFFPL